MKTSKLIILALFSFSLTANAATQTFTIPKGKHYPKGINVGLFYNSKLNFKAKFDSSAAYVFTGSDAADQTDINKLYGFSDCTSLHHKNSARVGWNYNPATKTVDVWGYAYANAKRSNIYLGSAEMNTFESYTIQVNGDHYLFHFKGNTVSLPRGCTTSKALGYRDFPYFGGNQVAPHEVKISIK